jgi:hypothetical protein
MVKVLATRTAEYMCGECDENIVVCDRCHHYLETHDGFDPDGDEINCTGKRHVVPGCKLKVI